MRQKFNTRLLLLILLLAAANIWASPLRVTSWDFEMLPQTNVPSRISIGLAAGTLKELDPDIILLQHVRDWQMCNDLARVLKPAEYSVVICSSFRAEAGEMGDRQAAILARKRAYFSWSEGWQTNGLGKPHGGYAFAAIQIAGQRIGLFSVLLQTAQDKPAGRNALLGGPLAQSASIQQVLEEIESLRNWITNQVQTFVIGGCLNSLRPDVPTPRTSALRLLEDAQFFDICQQLPASLRATSASEDGKPASPTEYIFTELPTMVSHAEVLPVPFAQHYPITCEVEPGPETFAATPQKRIEALPASQISTAAQNDLVTPEPSIPLGAATQTEGSTSQQLKWFAGGAGVIVGLAATIWFLAARSSRARRLPAALLPASFEGMPSSYTVVLGPGSTTGSAADEQPGVSPATPVVHLGAKGATETQSAVWQRRALAAEHRADQATAIVRHGLLPHLREWLKHKLLSRLLSDRTKLLRTQQAATLDALAADERLARIKAQIQQKTQAYERRIEDLTRDLLAAKEENRELIRARIAEVKAELEAARARMLAEAKGESEE